MPKETPNVVLQGVHFSKHKDNSITNGTSSTVIPIDVKNDMEQGIFVRDFTVQQCNTLPCVSKKDDTPSV